jgi:hypothetical protein
MSHTISSTSFPTAFILVKKTHTPLAMKTTNVFFSYQRIYSNIISKLIAPFLKTIRVIVTDSSLPQKGSKRFIRCLGAVKEVDGSINVALSEKVHPFRNKLARRLL